ncbi:class A sortase [Secundilactobacillus folii]|uniref:Sortase n=1 Tax=Secundilactobacillus folii TaxID=2678357 RepID=A0A7X2XXW8_9LACO|nr:class A sortase [Secundilactobacillus folii]MTV82948.1 sortase [Secundilactobacillus folii]
MKNSGRSKFTKWAYRVGFTILILISLGLIFNQQIKNYMVSSYQPKITAKSADANNRKKADFNFKNAKALNFTTVAKARMNSQKILTIGQILVPSSSVHLPIAKGVSNQTLALAAGTMRADQKMGHGNYPLAGHHMVRKDILFSPLYFKTRVGDKIYLTNMKKVFTYKVYRREFIAATRVDVVNQTRANIVTLVTCDATGARRLMIRGKLTNTAKYSDTPVKIQKEFAAKFNNK